MDEKLRKLERLAKQGDPAALAAWNDPDRIEMLGLDFIGVASTSQDGTYGRYSYNFGRYEVVILDLDSPRVIFSVFEIGTRGDRREVGLRAFVKKEDVRPNLLAVARLAKYESSR